MDYSKYVLLVVFWIIGRLIHCGTSDNNADCTLHSSPTNPRPYLIKLAVDGAVRCIGALVTPEFVISSATRLIDVDVDKLSFTATMYTKPPNIACTAVRKMRKKIWAYPNKDVSWWELASGFSVKPTLPYIFHGITDMSATKIQNMIVKFANDGIYQPCIVPVYKDKTMGVQRDVVVRIVSGEMVPYWTDVLCDGNQTCRDVTKRTKFFAYDLHNYFSKDWEFFSSALLYCWGLPVGTLNTVMSNTGKKALPQIKASYGYGIKHPNSVLVFDSLEHSILFFRKYAERDWDPVNVTTTEEPWTTIDVKKLPPVVSVIGRYTIAGRVRSHRTTKKSP